jgi:hypothetical protein
MNRRSEASAVHLPGHEETIAPVTILDAEGRVIQVIPAEEFRRTRAVLTRPTVMSWRRRQSPSTVRPESLVGEPDPVAVDDHAERAGTKELPGGEAGSLTIAAAQP